MYFYKSFFLFSSAVGCWPPCQNNGLCMKNTCYCSFGYTGTHCQEGNGSLMFRFSVMCIKYHVVMFYLRSVYNVVTEANNLFVVYLCIDQVASFFLLRKPHKQLTNNIYKKLRKMPVLQLIKTSSIPK